jgi:hypothetical protein
MLFEQFKHTVLNFYKFHIMCFRAGVGSSSIFPYSSEWKVFFTSAAHKDYVSFLYQ